ncbi:MAG TPA: MFS transporter [Stellaceae bacterium]|nr:MFS transporter [Stellaceae bacterium]
MTDFEHRPAHRLHPSVFMFLFAPYGIATGFVNVTLGFALTTAGVPVAEVAAIVAVGLLPQTWKVLWAPIIDTTLTRKRWYVLAATTTGLAMAATGFVPATAESLPLFYALVFGFNVTVSFLTMSVESLMAHATDDSQRGRAGGWLQAGNLGGLGLGGGAGLWLAEHVQGGWLPATVLGTACIACGAGLVFIDEPPPERERLGRALLDVAADVWSVAASRRGFLAMILFVLPIGTGAAANLWADVAGDWHADADTVAFVGGVMSGLISAAGCLVGGYLCDAMHRLRAYALYGLLLALCAVVMAAAPRTPAMFVVISGAYNFITGLSYAAFTAVSLEAIGRGAAATKYNLLACLANMPIAYMTYYDGKVQTGWGSGSMFLFEAACGVLSIVAFSGILAAVRRYGFGLRVVPVT